MRIRTGIGVLLSCACCAGLAACTAAASSGPDVTVTDPAVGRPAPPDSVQGALSRMAFTPYAALGLSDNDGLAPNESSSALTSECMSVAGFPGSAGLVQIGVRVSVGSIAFSQPWGAWGYLGIADAEQYGFLLPRGSALSNLGIGAPQSGSGQQNSSAAEQAAAEKCATISQDFTNEVDNGPLAGIATMADDIYNDVGKNAAIKNATKAWSACMAKNGYNYPDPMTAFRDQMQNIYGGSGKVISIGGTSISTEQNQAQIAMAVTDANCTQSTDLAGIYFAVQESYEQQVVNANQQALAAAVQQFRADYQKEVSKLPGLLKTTKAVPFGPVTSKGRKQVVTVPGGTKQ